MSGIYLLRECLRTARECMNSNDPKLIQRGIELHNSVMYGIYRLVIPIISLIIAIIALLSG
jgi:hypothetical protein